MALSKRKKNEIDKAKSEVANHPELIRMLVDGQTVEVRLDVTIVVRDKNSWRGGTRHSLLQYRKDISSVREPYVLRQVRSWLNRKAGQRSRHTKNDV
jgi:hypothetical protein